MRTIKKPFAYSIFITIASCGCMSSFAADTQNQTHDNAQTNVIANDEQGLLYQVPRLIDSTPTFLPEQSNQSTVPSTIETENTTWTDRQQKGIREWADRTAHKIDNWFGDTDPNQPATASLRIILDSTWNKHDGYELSPRIRGKLKLPTLERKVSLVFGDDSLDNELANNIAITNENPASQNNKNIDNKKTRDDNGSIALRWSEISSRLPFQTDFDIGIRSGDDIYTRLKASKDWQLENHFGFHAEQIYRYGIDSKNYLRTNLELTQTKPNSPILSNQLSLTHADAQDDDLSWDNFSFRQHQFFKDNSFSYGIYTGGFYNDSDLRLNSYGPFVSWRQPFLREWFFVQGDLNYLNDHRADRSHFLGALVRLEALF